MFAKLNMVLILGLFVLGAGCTKSSTPGSLNPIQQVGCDVESAVTSAAGSAIAAAINCSNQPQIAADVQNALGNVNLCSAGLASAGLASLAKPMWSKVGDVKKSDIDAAKQKGMKAQAIAPMGVVGNIACPIVVNTLLGFATNSIPASWGCSASTSASSLGQVIVSACEAAIPL